MALNDADLRRAVAVCRTSPGDFGSLSGQYVGTHPGTSKPAVRVPAPDVPGWVRPFARSHCSRPLVTSAPLSCGHPA
jgi:hypothetical protein